MNNRSPYLPVFYSHRLALALQKNAGSELGSDESSRYRLERAAEQGRIDAAMALARSPRSAEDKLRWLIFAAEGGLAEAQYKLYHFMMKSVVANYKSRNAMDCLKSAAESGLADEQYELGRILAHGDQQQGIEKNSKKARQWWDKAADNGHGRVLEELAWCYTQAPEGFPRDPARAISLLEKAAARGDARIQYELGAIFLFSRHGIAPDLEMGRKWWDLALAYEKGRYGLAQHYQQAQYWYRKLLRAYESGRYLGDVDIGFITFQRRRFEYMSKARQYQEDRSRRYEQAVALERQIMEIEDRYRLEYQKTVNGLNRRDGSLEGKKQYRAQVERLRQKYIRQREIEKIIRIAPLTPSSSHPSFLSLRLSSHFISQLPNSCI